MGGHSSAADTSTTGWGVTTGDVGDHRGLGALLVTVGVAVGLVLASGCSATYAGSVAETEPPPETTITTATTSGVTDDSADLGDLDADGSYDVDDDIADEAIVEPEAVERPPLPVFDWAAFESRLLDGWTDYRGLTAAAVIDGQVVWTAARGEADPSLRFRLASLSKVLTAIVIHQLIAEGRLALDQPVGSLAASALGVESMPPRSEALTPAMLLSHRSGFEKYQTLFFEGPQRGDWRSAAARGLSDGPRRDNSFLYTNMNYVVLGAVIEALTGLDYETAVRTRVLDPLGAGGMRLAGTRDVREGEVEHWSGPTRHYMEMLGPAGAWIGTASDMALVLGALAPGGVGPGRPLDAGGLELLTMPGAYGPLQGGFYANGVMFDGRGAFGHTGSIENSRTMGMVTPDGVAWTVLINGKEPDRASAIGERVWAALDVARR